MAHGFKATEIAWSADVGSSAERLTLLALAKWANDDLTCFPSLSTLVTDTKLNEKTIREALKRLHEAGLITIKRQAGHNTRYAITPTKIGSTKNGSTEIDTPTKIGSTPLPKTAGVPLPKTVPEHISKQIKNREEEKPKSRKVSERSSFSIPRPEDVPEQLWADFVTHRKAKKAPITETVIKRTRSEAAKCSMTLSQAIEMMVARGWQGFEARFVLKDTPRNPFCPNYRESTPAPNPAHNPFIPRRAKTPEELQAEKEQREAEELFGGLFR